MVAPNKSSKNRHPAYACWIAMRARCRKPVGKNSCYTGISYSPRWESFELFWQDMGKSWSRGLTIDRIDSTKGYYKENCRWVDKYVQANNRSNNRKITFNGVTKNVSEWSRYLNINSTTIRQRLDAHGWAIEKTLTTPVGKRG